MIRAVQVEKHSPIVGEECALCRHPFAPGDEAVICPEDATRHHVHCWRSNGNRCTAYGCVGRGEIAGSSAAPVAAEPSPEPARRRKIRVLPSTSLGCAQSCLLLSIAIAIVLFAIGCYGMWAIADYIMMELLDWPYRAPVSQSLTISGYQSLRTALEIALM